MDAIIIEKSDNFSPDSSFLGYDVFFLDIESLGYRGDSIAKSIWKENNRANIIMITSEIINGMDLFSAHISGIIRKPVTWEGIRYELSDLRYPVAQ